MGQTILVTYVDYLNQQKNKYKDWTDQYDFRIGNPLPWLRLSVEEIPIGDILSEFQTVRHHLVDHRDYEDNAGWYSLCLHGIDVSKTNHWKTYGYDSKPVHSWTSVGNACPITKQWISNNFVGFTDRVRFMLLAPSGYISNHSDYPDTKLGPINISITNPVGCEFIWRNWGVHPWEVGQAYLMNVHYDHCVINNNINEERLHIIVDGYNNMEDGLIKRSFVDALSSYDLLDN
jgi:hypothetical protein